MLAVSYGTVSDIEILITLIALVGIVFGVYNIRDAWKDRRKIVIAKVFNGRRLIANFAVRGEIARVYMQSVFAALGLLAMTLPEAPVQNQPLKIVIFGAIFRWGLISVTAVCLFKSIDSWRVRRAVRKK